jgi:hypothetical protein
MSQDRFTKAYDQLIALGLPPRLVLLYGKLAFHAGADGRCFPKWATLAKEIGVNDRTTVYRLLRQLRSLKLVEWKRHGRYSNLYRVLPPDVAFLQRLDVARMQLLRRCKNATQKRSQPRKEKTSKEAVFQPASCAPPTTGGLAERLTQVWKHVPGAPGAKLLARVEAALGDAPRDQFAALLVSRRRKARSFGLAEQLAVEVSARWSADAAERKRTDEAETEADRQRRIRLYENALADPDTPPEIRSEIQGWLNELCPANGAGERNDSSGRSRETKPPDGGKTAIGGKRT